MDKIVVCPECGAQMTLQDGQVVFSCVDCGTRLYCIKGVVITKSQAKLLLKKLVEKKQAEKARLPKRRTARAFASSGSATSANS